jgi:uracil-DNA glycosylase
MNDWINFIKEESHQPYYRNILEFLEEDGKHHLIYPASQDIFNAFFLSPLETTKVVILGQDPYHNPGEAHGLSFSVQEGVRIPPSLKNIFKELVSDLGISTPIYGDLTSWAQQGVLLLNSCLTVKKNEPNSHKNIGWHLFTDRAIQKVSAQGRPIVFILWGNFARQKKSLIVGNHLILESAHPSPLSAHQGFFGSRPFSQANQFLISQGEEPIKWESIC